MILILVSNLFLYDQKIIKKDKREIKYRSEIFKYKSQLFLNRLIIPLTHHFMVYKVVAFSGSLQKASTNTGLLRAAI